MKAISLLLLIAVCSDFQSQPQLTFVINQDDKLTPIGNSIDDFWKSNKHFDYVSICGHSLFSQVKRRLKILNPVDIQDISVHSALIVRPDKFAESDTLYSDQFFQYWMIDGKVFEDTTNYFERTFSHLFIMNNSNGH